MCYNSNQGQSKTPTAPLGLAKERMMSTITYSKLMKNCKDGKMEVRAWAGEYAEIFVYPSDMSKRPTSRTVEVTNIPADYQK